jgi:hypothetical protein
MEWFRHMLDMLRQAHAQVTSACELAQAFAQMIQSRNASALEPWVAKATPSGVPELRTLPQASDATRQLFWPHRVLAWSA